MLNDPRWKEFGGWICFVLATLAFLVGLYFSHEGITDMREKRKVAIDRVEIRAEIEAEIEALKQGQPTPYEIGYICTAYNSVEFVIMKSYMDATTDTWYYDTMLLTPGHGNIGVYNGLQHGLIKYCNSAEE